ncbi:MAG TPA: AAA family ATPase [Thermoleophilaceae bacterium]|nr:AAA family ATPase [Thermoleophilaceae bacterium]
MTGSTLARQPNPLPNPFRPGNGVPPPYLAGRDRLLVAFEDWLREEPPLHANWALTGLRGTGKTVLLGEFAARAERAGWLTLQRELGDRHRDDVRFAGALAEDCEALIGRADAVAAVGQAIERGARWLRPRRISVGEVSVDPSYASEVPAPDDVMRSAFAQLDSILTHTERPGAILLYDEAHLLADDRRAERFPLSSLLAALAAVQRQRPRVRVVVCGLPTLSLNLKRARTYAERMFRQAVVGNLEADAAEEALAIPLATSGRSFGLSLIGEIVEQTAGYPYFLQFFGAFNCSRIGLEHVELADFQRVESALLHELDLAFFEDRFEGAAPTEQVLLLAMARSGGRVSLARLVAEVEAVNVPVGLRRLIDRGLVYRPTRATYDFTLPLFGPYLRRQAKIAKLSSRR